MLFRDAEKKYRRSLVFSSPHCIEDIINLLLHALSEILSEYRPSRVFRLHCNEDIIKSQRCSRSRTKLLTTLVLSTIATAYQQRQRPAVGVGSCYHVAAVSCGSLHWDPSAGG